MKKKKSTEFSKLIIIVSGIINLGVILFACVMMWRTSDTSPLSYLIPSVAAEVATGTGFYYAKAKTENVIKLKKQCGMTLSQEDFTGETY